MKRNFLIGLCLVVMAFTFNGCINAVEEITFNKDGSGTYALEMDLSGMMSLLSGGGLQNMLGIESEDGEAPPVQMPKVQDTTMTFMSLMEANGTDVSSLERKHIWESAKADIKINEPDGVMKMRMYFDFKQADDIKYFQENLGKLKGDDEDAAAGLSGMGDISGMMGGMGGMQANIQFAKKLFNRSTPKGENPLGDAGDDQTMDMIKMFLAGATYKTIYHFPRRVKSTTIKGAKVSKDEKTVTTEVEFLDLIEDSQILDGEVKLKRK